MIFLLLFSGGKSGSVEPPVEPPEGEVLPPAYPRLDLPYVNLYYGTMGLKPPSKPPKYKLIPRSALANAKNNIILVKPKHSIVTSSPRQRVARVARRNNFVLAKPRRNIISVNSRHNTTNAKSRQRIITLRSLA